MADWDAKTPRRRQARAKPLSMPFDLADYFLAAIVALLSGEREPDPIWLATWALNTSRAPRAVNIKMLAPRSIAAPVSRGRKTTKQRMTR